MRRTIKSILSLAVALVLLLALLPAAGAAENRGDLELDRAVNMGIGSPRAGDPQITFVQYYGMLDQVVALAAPDRLDAWRAATPEARSSDLLMTRFDGMFVLYLAAETMGGEYLTLTAAWWTLHDKISAAFDSDDAFWDTIRWNDQLYGEEYGGRHAQLGPGGDYEPWYYDGAAYFYAMGRVSLYSGRLLFDYDPVSNSMRPQEPLRHSEAMLAALRLFDSSSANFPLSPRWPSPADLELLDEAEARKREILASPNMDLSRITGSTYYISNSGNDNNTGKSPDSAWATLGRHNDGRWELSPGDAVLFERGGTWRGNLRCARGVTYSAYGAGPKPRLYGSPEDGTGAEKWTLWYDGDGKMIWRFYRDVSDCGGIVFNGGESWASRVFSFWNGSQAVRAGEPGLPFDIIQGLEYDLQFYSTFDMAAQQAGISPGSDYWVHNVDSRGPLYLRCDAGNPGERYEAIEFQASVVIDEGYPAPGYTGIVTCGGDNVIDNLCVMYRSTMGLDRAGTNNNTFQNCEVGWIGGGSHILNYTTPWDSYVPTSGECVRMEGVNNTTQNCYVHDGFDGGVTAEFDDAFLRDPYCFNLTIRDNVIQRCMSGVLIGDHNEDRNNTVKRYGGVRITGNYILDSGFGWSCGEHYDFTWGSEAYNGNAITLWDGPSCNGGIDIADNVLYRARFALVHMGTDEANSPSFSNNTYAQDNNGIVAYLWDEDRGSQARLAGLDAAKALDICQNSLGDAGAAVLPASCRPEVAFPAGAQVLLWTGAAAEIDPPGQVDVVYACRSGQGPWTEGLPSGPGDYEVRARAPGGGEGSYAEDFLDLSVVCFLQDGPALDAAFPVGGRGQVLVALYDAGTGRLAWVELAGPGADGAVRGLRLPAPGGGVLRAKVFVLDGLTALRPMAPAEEYPVAGRP